MKLTENEIFDGDEKVAYLDPEGRPRMTPGHGDKRESVIAFLDKREASLAETDPITEYEAEKEVETIAAERATPSPIITPSAADVRRHGSPSVSKPVCPLPGSPSQGEKSPEVIDWWFKHHPAIAKEKYARIRLNR